MFALAEIGRITGGTFQGDPSLRVHGVSTDSRSIQEGELYLALKGERFDGHDFIPALAGKYPVMYRDGEVPSPSIRVEDPLKAYGALARAWREKWGGIVVAVTGSSGKTSTKESIASLLSRYGPTHRTEANFNNEIGLPKTLLGIREHRYAVVEMGMRGVDEIRALARIAIPSLGIITNIGKAHLGRLGSQEAIQKAKGELFEELRGGLALANGDDPLARALLPSDGVSYGFGDCTIRGRMLDPATFTAEGCRVQLPVPGEHHASNALAAIAVAKVLGLALPAEWKVETTLPGRARALSVKGVTLWDETYNANPDSMRAAIKSLFHQPGRKILVLSEMGELGPDEEAEHEAIGQFLDEYPVELLVTVGRLAALYGKARQNHHHFANRNEAAQFLLPHLSEGDAVLFKGSRSTRMEEVLDRVRVGLEGV